METMPLLLLLMEPRPYIILMDTLVGSVVTLIGDGGQNLGTRLRKSFMAIRNVLTSFGSL